MYGVLGSKWYPSDSTNDTHIASLNELFFKKTLVYQLCVGIIISFDKYCIFSEDLNYAIRDTFDAYPFN